MRIEICILLFAKISANVYEKVGKKDSCLFYARQAYGIKNDTDQTF